MDIGAWFVSAFSGVGAWFNSVVMGIFNVAVGFFTSIPLPIYAGIFGIIILIVILNEN